MFHALFTYSRCYITLTELSIGGILCSTATKKHRSVKTIFFTSLLSLATFPFLFSVVVLLGLMLTHMAQLMSPSLQAN